MFNDLNLNDEEIMKIIKDYKPLILSKSIINNKLDEDLCQEIEIKIFKVLSKNRNKKIWKNATLNKKDGFLLANKKRRCQYGI